MLTQSDVAQHLDLSTRTLRTLLERGVLPREGREPLDMDECRVAYIRHLREMAAGRKGEDDTLDLASERARLAKEQADGHELKNAVARGELIPADVVVSHWSAEIVACSTRLASIRPRLRTELPHLSAEDAARIGDLIDEARTELADGLPASTGDGEPEGEGTMASSPEDDEQRVGG